LSPIGLGQRHVVLLVNASSRKGEAWFEQAKAKLTEKGIVVASTESFAHAPELLVRVEEEAKRGSTVIIGGGDGTMSAVANILARRDSTLAVLPLGTGNAFARDLGIPTNLEDAVEVVVNGRIAQVDLGVCDAKYFLNVVTIGLTVTVAKSLTVALKRRFGRFIYAVALFKALRNQRPFEAKIETENGLTEIEAIQLVLGNGHYHAGPLPLAPSASITSGALRLYAVEAGSRVGLLKYALLLPTGLQGVLKTVHSESTKGGVISCRPKQAVVVDGEVSDKTPLTFSIAPRALNVMVPQAFTG